MTLLVTLHFESPVLETAVASASDVAVTAEQRTMAADRRLDLTVRATGDDLEAFEEGLDADETVERWVAVGTTAARNLYRIRLTHEASSGMDYNTWADGLMVPLSSKRTERGWLVNGFVDDRSVLQTIARNCETNDVTFELVRTSWFDQLDTRHFALTELQAETLLTAFDRGFYSVPREVNLEELAAPLEVSHQALSERLRRGVHSLIETTIAKNRDPVPTDDPDRLTETNTPDEDLPFEPPIALNL